MIFSRIEFKRNIQFLKIRESKSIEKSGVPKHAIILSRLDYSIYLDFTCFKDMPQGDANHLLHKRNQAYECKQAS